MKKFETGKFYYGRSLCDYDCVYQYEIVDRTEKSVWFYEPMEKGYIRKKIHVHDGVEFFYPHGTYSMATVIKADKQVEPVGIDPGLLKIIASPDSYNGRVHKVS